MNVQWKDQSLLSWQPGAGFGQAFDSAWDLSCLFSHLTPPKSQATAYFTNIISHRWDPPLRRSQSKNSPWVGPVKYFTAEEGREESECLEHGAVTTLSMSACTWGQLPMLPVAWEALENGVRLQSALFYLCWHGNKLVSLFISSLKVL